MCINQWFLTFGNALETFLVVTTTGGSAMGVYWVYARDAAKQTTMKQRIIQLIVLKLGKYSKCINTH